MKKKWIWKSLLVIGILPYVLPFLTSITRDSYLSLLDWLVLYSFVYWPTYLAGLVLVLAAIWNLAKTR